MLLHLPAPVLPGFEDRFLGEAIAGAFLQVLLILWKNVGLSEEQNKAVAVRGGNLFPFRDLRRESAGKRNEGSGARWQSKRLEGVGGDRRHHG